MSNQSQQQQSVGGEAISRHNVEIEGQSYRMYTDGQRKWPSVSTVLDARPTPDKDESIQGWRNWLKGQPDRPDPDEVLRYKSKRGTLAHYKCLDPLADYDLLGDEEIDAYTSLDGWEHRHKDALKSAKADVAWSVEAFQELCEKWGIAQFDGRGLDADVIQHRARAVEHYVVNDDIGYAGQYDLAYKNSDGDTIVADIKTSKADSVSDLLRKKMPRYGLQLTAYAHATTFDVDELQIIWIAPDTHKSAVIPDSEWPRTREELQREFIDIATTVHQTTFTEY